MPGRSKFLARASASACARATTELKDKLNAAIKAIRANGTYDTFTKKYFDFDIYGQ